MAVLLSVSGVFAQERNSVNVEGLDDVKVGSEYQIDDWEILFVYRAGNDSDYWNDLGYRSRYDDGSAGADTLWMTLYITNITFTPKNYLAGAAVMLVYDDQYSINGWWNQLTVDNYYVYSSDVFEIDPFYEGHYQFGVKVPDYIIKDTKPLRMEITMGDVVLTYHIRK